MVKKGQLTIFMLLGIILLLVFFLLILGKENLTSLNKTSHLKFFPVESMLNTCIEAVAKETAVTVARNGGLKIPLPFTRYGNDLIALHYQNKKNLAPSVDKVEIEIASLMNENLELCYAKLQLLHEIGFSFEAGAPSSEVIIRDKDILFMINYPIRTVHGKQQVTYDSFSIHIPYSFKPLIMLSSLAVQETIRDPSTLCISCLSAFALQNGLEIHIQNIGDFRLLYSVRSKNSPVSYRFTHEYS